ncbi:MAG: hypothetical protein ACK5Z5_04695 [Neisseriaceae bacterium]
MNTFTQQIQSIDLIYNNPEIIASVVDKNGNILYVSESMQQISCSSVTQAINSHDIKDMAIQDLNNKVIQTNKIIQYIYIMQTDVLKYTLFKCSKIPVYEGGSSKPVAILTIQDQFKVFDIPDKVPHNLPQNISEIGQVILFCMSLKLSYGETFQFITTQYNQSLKFNDFKTHCQSLLKTLQISSLKELINVDILKYCNSVLRKLLNDGRMLMKFC